jgi:glycerol kinase
MILAIDQGTTGTTCLVVDDELRVRGRGYRALEQHFPQPGWVEHDPEEIWTSVVAAGEAALHEAGIPAGGLRAIGITNQRETTVLWERRTGRAVAPAIVWQDRRTAGRCRELPEELIRSRTGLVCDPYFSATKLEWLRRAHPEDGLAFGTIDSWLVWKLTYGHAHVTDATNASRTLLAALDPREWDDELLALFGVERSLLPRIVPSSGIAGEASFLGASVPIAGIAGDQQAALFGQGCHAAGEAKATYGTGTFVLVHAGRSPDPPPHGLLKTATADGAFALEGAVLTGGAAIQWLREELGVLGDAAESEEIARSVDSSGGVVFVPALAGLGSPQWDAGARGLIAGITRATTRAHLVRAALEAIALQVADVVEAIPGGVRVLRADGGASANAFVMQLQADLLGCPVEVAAERETTALGAAALAGLGAGVWRDPADVRALIGRGAIYKPAAAQHDELRARWRLALSRTLLR